MGLSARSPRRRPGKPLRVEPWASDRAPGEIGDQAEYVGSPEHKAYVNPVLGEAPQPRSDASRCDEYAAEEWPRFTLSLRAAICAGCVSGVDAHGWPRHVWGWHDGRLFQARHRTDPPGNRYKGWWIEEEERPDDPEGRLDRLRRAALEPQE